MKIIIPIIVAAILVIVAAVCVVNHAVKKRIAIENASKVIACSYSYGGGMEGERETINISLDDEGIVHLTYYSIEHNGAEEETYTKEVPFEAIEKIREICKEREILGWGELKDSKMFLLDAPTTSITITYAESDFYSFSSNKTLPRKKGSGVFTEIYNVLESYK